MALRCVVFRGLPMEVEEEINKFLASNEVRVVQMTQSETAGHISITMLVEDPEPFPEGGP